MFHEVGHFLAFMLGAMSALLGERRIHAQKNAMRINNPGCLKLSSADARLGTDVATRYFFAGQLNSTLPGDATTRMTIREAQDFDSMSARPSIIATPEVSCGMSMAPMAARA